MTQRRRVTRAEVVQGALDLIDRDGADGLTIRRLAGELGVPPMSLYGHVRDKADLVDAVTHAVFAEVRVRPPDPAAPARAAIEEAWRNYRAALLRHPKAAALVIRRTRRGNPEAEERQIDRSVGWLRHLGLDERQAVDAHRALIAFTTGNVLNEVNLPRQPDGTLVEPAPATEDMPHYAAIRQFMAAPDFDAAFEFGLRALLDGIEAGAARA